MPAYNALAQHILITKQIATLGADLLARSPSRWAQVMEYYRDNENNTGMVYDMLLQHLDALDEMTEAQRTICKLADDRSPNLAAAMAYYQGE